MFMLVLFSNYVPHPMCFDTHFLSWVLEQQVLKQIHTNELWQKSLKIVLLFRLQLDISFDKISKLLIQFHTLQIL